MDSPRHRVSLTAGVLMGCSNAHINKGRRACRRRCARAAARERQRGTGSAGTVRAAGPARVPWRLRIEFVNGWRGGQPDAERGSFADVRSGQVDLAWVGARAVRAEGVPAFDPLIAPINVTNYATESAVLTSPVAATLLDATRP